MAMWVVLLVLVASFTWQLQTTAEHVGSWFYLVTLDEMTDAPMWGISHSDEDTGMDVMIPCGGALPGGADGLAIMFVFEARTHTGTVVTMRFDDGEATRQTWDRGEGFIFVKMDANARNLIARMLGADRLRVRLDNPRLDVELDLQDFAKAWARLNAECPFAYLR